MRSSNRLQQIPPYLFAELERKVVPASAHAHLRVWRVVDQVAVLLALVQVWLNEDNLVTTRMQCFADAAVVRRRAVPVRRDEAGAEEGDAQTSVHALALCRSTPRPSSRQT